MELEKLEWAATGNGLELERKLPNGIVFGSRVEQVHQGVSMEMWLTNGTNEALSGMRSQVCVMLKGLIGFNSQRPSKLGRQRTFHCDQRRSFGTLDHHRMAAKQPNLGQSAGALHSLRSYLPGLHAGRDCECTRRALVLRGIRCRGGNRSTRKCMLSEWRDR